jgi:hypothetical protein
VIAKGVRGLLRGQLTIGTAAREAFRRGRLIAATRRERATLDQLADRPAELTPDFEGLSPSQRLEHFRTREQPSFLPGFQLIVRNADQQRREFPAETKELIESAKHIAAHRWPLLGFGEKDFGSEINWLRDPLSGRIWPAEYHADVVLWHNDGSDIRVLWELNRLGHFVTLARAYAVAKDETFAAEFFEQLDSWRKQNPLGRGPNWACAMEVALRAINLLQALAIFRTSPVFTETQLLSLLQLFEQSGEHILRHLEFSYVSTSNHYLSDVFGLLWLGILLPELKAADKWQTWALRELFREIDKQILNDGADYEGSTSYHAFVLELLLYSFVLLETNQMSIPDKYRERVGAMLHYLDALLRPDGTLPLIGDVDSTRLVQIGERKANDRRYLLAVGAVFFKDASLKPAGENAEELFWVLGSDGLRLYERLGTNSRAPRSRDFADIGSYVMRHDDLHLMFNANGIKPGRPASHRHNDLLSIEVSVSGCPFIVDAGSFVYTADLEQRHRFRSTAYHSTVVIDDVEQQPIESNEPFAIGDEAGVKVHSWNSSAEHDEVVAEHSGYQRLPEPVTHRRSISFLKTEGWWLVEDTLTGAGSHKIDTRFHFNSGLNVTIDGASVIARAENGLLLCVHPLDVETSPLLEEQATSTDYGEKQSSTTACWTARLSVPVRLRWAIVPVRHDETIAARLKIVESTSSVQALDFGQ